MNNPDRPLTIKPDVSGLCEAHHMCLNWSTTLKFHLILYIYWCITDVAHQFQNVMMTLLPFPFWNYGSFIFWHWKDMSTLVTTNWISQGNHHFFFLFFFSLGVTSYHWNLVTLTVVLFTVWLDVCGHFHHFNSLIFVCSRRLSVLVMPLGIYAMTWLRIAG